MINVNTALALVKARLNRVEGDTSLDDYLTARINAAAEELTGTGIVLEDTPEDTLLIVDLAVYNYSNRDKQAGLPDWMRMRIRNRWLRQGVAEDDS